MLDLITDFFYSENWAPPTVDLPVVKIFSRCEVDLKWVWLVEPPLVLLNGLVHVPFELALVSSCDALRYSSASSLYC